MSTTVAVTNVALASITPVLTTTFTPTATSCTQNQLTMLANRGYEIWMNMPVPVAGETYSDCWPSQFMTSYLLSAGGVTQPAFNPLICPENWYSVGPFTSNYIACCPTGYSFANPTVSVPANRPAFGGTCYTPIEMATPVRVTAYGTAGVTATITWTATVTNAQAYAYPIDGFAFGVAAQKSLGTSAITQTATASTGATYTVTANVDPTFIPSSLTPKVNDTIVFQFNAGNHSVTQSTFDDPCSPVSGGFDSGFLINTNTTGTSPQASFKLLTNTPQYFYSKGKGDCGNGMVFVSNPSSADTEAAFKSKAMSTSGSKSSTAVKIGVGVAIPVAAILVAIIGFFFWRRNKQRRGQERAPAPVMDAETYATYDHLSQEPKPVAEGTSELDNLKTEEETSEPETPMAPFSHELHNSSSFYEMGGSMPNPYELQGSTEYITKR